LIVYNGWLFARNKALFLQTEAFDMKLIENNEEIIIHDYPWCLFLLGLISGVLGVYIFLQGDKANFFVALILFIVFSGYAKKRIFTLNKRKNIFAYKEKNLFKTKVFSGKASDIETIDIHGVFQESCRLKFKIMPPCLSWLQMASFPG